MNCPRCGAGIPNGAGFCQNCGTPVAQQPAAHGNSPLSPAVRLQKKLATSPLFLTGAIAYSCAILFTLARAAAGTSWLTSWIYDYMDLMGDGSFEMYMVMRSLQSSLAVIQGASMFGTLLSCMVLGVIAAGMWMLFASGLDKTGAPMRDTGLSMIRVVAIIQLVCQSLLLAVMEVFAILVGIVAGSEVEAMWGVVFIIMLLFAVCLVPMILMYAQLIKALGVMRNTMRTGVPSDKISAYVAVMSIIAGSLNLLMIFGGFFTLLTSVSNAVAGIVFGVFLFEYKSKMRSLMMGRPVEDIYPTGNVPVNSGVGAGPVQNVPQNSPYVYPQEEVQPVVPPTQVVPETTVLSQDLRQDTTVLNAAPMPTVRLIRARDGSVITVDRAQFRIGRDPGVADYIITDNTAVGRQHADIVQHNGACYIVDLDSVNHVYVNGAQLQPGVECELQNGDEILLANEAFRVDIC